MPSHSKACKHEALLVHPSSHAIEAKFKNIPLAVRARATTTTRNHVEDVSALTFPAPLVLAGDDLALDPNQRSQSLLSWTRGHHRNAVTDERNIIYLGRPSIAPAVKRVEIWSKPKVKGKVDKIRIDDVLDYLTAFYHGLTVKMLPANSLSFARWENEKTSHIALHTLDEAVRIRTRVTDGDFNHQLNLDDILDAAISVLPSDAYALLLLVDQDLYEDEDDEFVCGRAYGGSRVAVVSTARYNPLLDEKAGVERDHAWPASHCELYAEGISAMSERQDLGSALRAAVEAYASKSTEGSLTGSWLARVCRTASHELGHCFGIAHCVYYACCMQGTASVQEDARQPMYLCPVDLAKLEKATGTGNSGRHKMLLEFCEKHLEVPTFAAFAAWLRCQVE